MRESWKTIEAEPIRPAEARRPAEAGDDADLEFLAGMLDDRFRIPGTNIRFGLDALIGLIPGVGDAVSGVLSSYLIWRAHQLGASKLTLLRMAGNVAIDSAIGVVPIFGDLFDWRFRSNRRNLELLRRQRLTSPGSGIRRAAFRR
jgi:hypothetical protein